MRARVVFTVLVAAGCGRASADVIVFDNSDLTFDWEMSYPASGLWGAYLRIDQPPTQSGAPHPAGLLRASFPMVATPHFEWSEFSQGPGGTARVVRDATPTVIIDEIGVPNEFSFATALGPGDVVGPASNLAIYGVYQVANPYTEPPTDVSMSLPAYIGVSVELNAATHYGWIRLDELARPIAWAYETLPNTPITIVPAPGAAALLGCVAAVAGLRRRRW